MITKTDKIFMTVSFIVCFLLLFVIGRNTNAASSATVAATVTAQNLSVGVSDGTVAYSTIGTGSTTSTLTLSDSQKATNDGNVTEALNIRGMNSTSSGVGWTLAASAGSDEYYHKFSTNSGVGWTALTTNNQTLQSSVGVGGTKWFDLEIGTPSSTSDYNEQTVNVTVQATAI